MGRDIEIDRRMAAFLKSEDYKGETWMTEEVQYIRWLKAGKPVYLPIVKVKGFRDILDEEDIIEY